MDFFRSTCAKGVVGLWRVLLARGTFENHPHGTFDTERCLQKSVPSSFVSKSLVTAQRVGADGERARLTNRITYHGVRYRRDGTRRKGFRNRRGGRRGHEPRGRVDRHPHRLRVHHVRRRPVLGRQQVIGTDPVHLPETEINVATRTLAGSSSRVDPPMLIPCFKYETLPSGANTIITPRQSTGYPGSWLCSARSPAAKIGSRFRQPPSNSSRSPSRGSSTTIRSTKSPARDGSETEPT